MGTLHHGDCLEVMAAMDAGSVDAVVCDPPYNVGKKYGDYSDNLPVDEYLVWLRMVYLEASRVSRDAVVFFPGIHHMFDVHEMLRGTGLRVVRPLAWHKKEFAGDLWSDGPAMCWEPIVWASGCKHPFYNRIFGTQGRDCLVVPSIHGNPHKGPHPCPKPLPVMRWLVNLFAPPQGLVLDPLMGSGTTGVACAMEGREFIGIDRELVYVKIARRRIAAAEAQTRLEVD